MTGEAVYCESVSMSAIKVAFCGEVHIENAKQKKHAALHEPKDELKDWSLYFLSLSLSVSVQIRSNQTHLCFVLQQLHVPK